MTRPKIFHRTLQLDRGGEAALVWGRRECERLASLGTKAFNRSVYIGDFLVRLRGEQFSDGHYVTRIWVESAILNRLHTWPVTTALKNF
ncbi:MAG TPA: hypothetical protein VH040_11065, partial [Usitatibacter sp.]|nr:hypothetical protein [Usitatibacter sp.]